MSEPLTGEGAELASGRLLVLVAPAPGRLRVLPPRAFRGGWEWVEPGDAVARIEHSGRADAILAPVSGRVGGMLRRDGEPVSTGEPVAWIEPAGERRA